ncbi:MAG: hypothetical protein IPG81_26245 [Sandaracinaceae bacterium]|nr:hypothetical protein [Sandaracinaceae bacterium]
MDVRDPQGGWLVDVYAWLELQVRSRSTREPARERSSGLPAAVVSLGLRWDLDLLGAPVAGAIRPELTLPSGR